MSKIAVIGAGVTGTTTAYNLAQKGYEVTVFEKNRYSAMETSFANGGQLSASNAEVWNSWPTIAKAMGWLFRKDAPLLLNPIPSLHKYSWMAEFLMAIRHYEKNTQETVRLALKARQRLYEIADKENILFDHEKNGILHFYKNQQSFDKARKANEVLVAAGLERHAIKGEEVIDKEPSLVGRFVGGFFTEGDSTGDIHKFTQQLMERCIEQGVQVKYCTYVKHIKSENSKVHIHWADEDRPKDLEQSTFSAVVICSGVESRRLAKMVGDRVNIYPVKGYSITVSVPENSNRDVAPWVSLLDDDAKIVTSRLGVDRYRVAGTAEINGLNKDIRADRIRPLVKWVEGNHPRLRTSQCVPWAGLRPMMPDMMPCVRQGKQKGIFYNTGHGHLGWTLSAATADLISDIVASNI